MRSFSIAETKAKLSQILALVEQGEEVLLTRRGHPLARLVPATPTRSILGAGRLDPDLRQEVLAADDWWKPLSKEDAEPWYESIPARHSCPSLGRGRTGTPRHGRPRRP